MFQPRKAGAVSRTLGVGLRCFRKGIVAGKRRFPVTPLSEYMAFGNRIYPIIKGMQITQMKRIPQSKGPLQSNRLNSNKDLFNQNLDCSKAGLFGSKFFPQPKSQRSCKRYCFRRFPAPERFSWIKMFFLDQKSFFNHIGSTQIKTFVD